MPGGRCFPACRAEAEDSIVPGGREWVSHARAEIGGTEEKFGRLVAGAGVVGVGRDRAGMDTEASDHHWGHRSTQLALGLTLLCAKRVGTLFRSRTVAGRQQPSVHGLPGDPSCLDSAAQDPRGRAPHCPLLLAG